MSDHDTNDRDGTDEGDSGTDDRVRGFRLEAGLRSLSGLLGDLVEVSASKSPPPPENPDGWTTVDEEREGRQRGDDSSKHTRTKRGRSAELDDHLIDTRIDDDEFIVTADIPGATKDDLSVGINPRTNNLVIGRNGTVIGRIDIPWKSHEPTNVWFNNGILEIRLQADGA